MSTAPGIKAQHAIVTETCRKNHGDLGAFIEAKQRMERAYFDALNARGEDGAKYHLVLYVEPPAREGEQ